MTEIGFLQLAICLVPCTGLFWLAWRWSGSARELVIATARMVVQLLAIGFVLVSIFGAQSPLVGVAVVTVMVVVSSIIAVRVVRTDRRAAFGQALIAIGGAGGLVLIFVLWAVLQVGDPAYQPRVIIPIAGMIFSNAMTAVTLAAERLSTELTAGHDFAEARRATWAAALIPQVNALMAVGLVALPGLMTGQILSGVDPLVAVRYQIVVMAMVLQSAGYSVAIFLWLRGRQLALG